MATDSKYLEVAYDRYCEEDRKELYNRSYRILYPHPSQDQNGELDILINRYLYIQKKKAYKIIQNCSHMVGEPLDFEIMKEYCPEHYFDGGDILIHMLERPLEEMPLYINSSSELVNYIAKWRIERGK